MNEQSESPMNGAGEETAAPVSEAPRRRRGRPAWRDRVEHALFAAFASGLGALAPRRAARAGGRLARLYIALSASRRRILYGNLQAAFPDLSREEIEALGRRSVASFGESMVEFLDSTRLSQADIESRVELTGVEHLRAAHDRGKGVFFLSGHFGNWEFGAIRTGLLGDPIASVVRPLDNPRLERELARRRTRFGNTLIRKKNAAREILRRLRENGLVAILIDQNVLPAEAVFVPFFGRLAATSPALALLQRKTDAAVVPSFAFPLGDGRYRVEFQEPILASEFESAGDRDAMIRAATARYMAVTEQVIRREPAAWLWIHNRWRTRPEGEK